MMNEPGLHAAMADFLAHPSYHPCLLLVHPDIRRLMDASDELASVHGWPRLRVGRELSAALLAVPPADRPRAAQRWMEEQVSQMAPGPVLCTEIDLLFEPTLQLDPLRLLLDISRATPLVVAWPGSHEDGVLAYAVPEHKHYRVWHKPQVHVVVL